MLAKGSYTCILLVSIQGKEGAGTKQLGQSLEPGKVKVKVSANLDLEVGQPISPDAGFEIEGQAIGGAVIVVDFGRSKGVAQAYRMASTNRRQRAFGQESRWFGPG